jgi:hypothetical protein
VRSARSGSRAPGGHPPGATWDRSSRHPTHHRSAPSGCGWASARTHRHSDRRRGRVCAIRHLCCYLCRHLCCLAWRRGWGAGSVGCRASANSRLSSETTTWTHAATRAGHPRASAGSRMAIASVDSGHSYTSSSPPCCALHGSARLVPLAICWPALTSRLLAPGSPLAVMRHSLSSRSCLVRLPPIARLRLYQRPLYILAVHLYAFGSGDRAKRPTHAYDAGKAAPCSGRGQMAH